MQEKKNKYNNSCYNCREFGHENNQCPYACWRCEIMPQQDENGFVVPCRCELPEHKQGNLDRPYLRLLSRDELGKLPDSLYQVHNEFIQRLERGSINELGHLPTINVKDKQKFIPNPLYLPFGTGAYNWESLCKLTRLFYLDALNSACKKRFFEPNMRIFKDVRVVGKYRSEQTKVIIQLPMKNRDFETLLLDQTNESFLSFMLPHDDALGGQNLHNVRFLNLKFEVGRLVFFTELAGNLIYDEKGECKEYVSIGFDFGQAALQNQLNLIERSIQEVDFRPEWLNSFMQDFNHKPPQDSFMAEMIRFEEIREFLQMLGWDWYKLDDAQKNALVGMLENTTFALIGPPGTGKTQIVAFAALFMALYKKKKVLIVTPRNRTADDIANKIISLLKVFRQSMHNSPLGKITRRYPKSRKEYGVPKEFVTISGLTEDEVERRNQKTDMTDVQVCVTTLGHNAHRDFFELFNPDIVCIDEAALIDPTEFISTICRQFRYLDKDEGVNLYSRESNLDRIWLVGDVYQMHPKQAKLNIFSPKALFDSGLLTSPLHRAIRNNIPNVVLQICRRGPDTVFDWSLDRYYPGKDVHALAIPEVGLYFRGDSNNPAFTNFYNRPLPLQSIFLEAPTDTMSYGGLGSVENSPFRRIAMDLIRLLLDKNSTTLVTNQDGTQRRLLPSDIAYITPYRAQLQRMLHEVQFSGIQNIDQVQMMTGDQCQGVEFPVTVVDFVRSDDSLGFLAGQDKNAFGRYHNGRMNVMLTRSKNTRFVIASVRKLEESHNDSDLYRLYLSHLNSQNNQVLLSDINNY